MAIFLLTDSLLLAQDKGGNQGPPGWMSLLPFLAIGVLFYFMMIKPERQKQQTHRDMLTQLKKSDRVVTAGGMKGIVTNVNREADEVTINVDESTGTKIRFSLSSVTRVDSPEAKSPSK